MHACMPTALYIVSTLVRNSGVKCCQPLFTCNLARWQVIIKFDGCSGPSPGTGSWHVLTSRLEAYHQGRYLFQQARRVRVSVGYRCRSVRVPRAAEAAVRPRDWGCSLECRCLHGSSTLCRWVQILFEVFIIPSAHACRCRYFDQTKVREYIPHKLHNSRWHCYGKFVCSQSRLFTSCTR